MFHNNQCNKNRLPHVAASILFADLEKFAHGYDHQLVEANYRFSSFPTAIRRQNLDQIGIRHSYKNSNLWTRKTHNAIHISLCMILDKESTTLRLSMREEKE